MMEKSYKKSCTKSIKKNGKWLISDDEKDRLLSKPAKLKLRSAKQFYVPKDQAYSQRCTTTYEHGALINKGVKIVGKQIISPGGLRGDIKTFSLAARRRMRMFMLKHKVNPDLMECAVTLTVPGPIMTPEEKTSLWKYWTKEVIQKEWACLWRLELQERGQFHWHCIMGLKNNYGAFQDRFDGIINKAKEKGSFEQYRVVRRTDRKTGLPIPHSYNCKEWLLKEMVSELWSKVLPGDRSVFVRDSTVHLEMDRTGTSWRRYMLDHTSKYKNEQLADTGKQWGIINRKLFVSSQVLFEAAFVDQLQYDIFNRALYRLRNGTKKNRKLFRKISQGQSVAFGNPETYKRLYEWSLIEYHEKIFNRSIPF